MQQVTVEAKTRETRGRNEAKRTRLTGEVPGIIYGGKGGPVSVSVNAKHVSAILRSDSGHNTIFTLTVDGKDEVKALLKDWQVDPVKGSLLHVDMMRVAMDVKMRVRIPVHTFGEAAGVKQQGGIFEMVTREVEIECLPADIPEEVKVDVSPLMIGKHLRAGELPFDTTKITLVTDPQRVIAHVVALKAEEVATPEAVAAEATAAPAEPEVIKKGKKEEEGEAEAAPEEKKKK